MKFKSLKFRESDTQSLESSAQILDFMNELVPPLCICLHFAVNCEDGLSCSRK